MVRVRMVTVAMGFVFVVAVRSVVKWEVMVPSDDEEMMRHHRYCNLLPPPLFRPYGSQTPASHLIRFAFV